MNLKKQQGENTKRDLIRCARRLFSRLGFHRTRFDEVAKSQGLTTGVLYHHFKNKQELFEKVFELCATEISVEVFQSADRCQTQTQGIVEGCLTYITQVMLPKNRKIMLEDAMSVLGWSKWKEIDERTSESGLLQAVQEGQQNGELKATLAPKALARFISGGTNELALWVSESRNQRARLKEVRKVFQKTLEGLKKEDQHD